MFFMDSKKQDSKFLNRNIKTVEAVQNSTTCNVRETVVDIAMTKPMDLGLPFTGWSLPKLKD
jgi:hypothetical protein